jgi:ligand-binding sensor domain-containing protein
MWDGGIDRMKIGTDVFTHYRSNSHDITSPTNDRVFYIVEDRQKNIWIGLWYGGLNLYDRKQNCFKRFSYGLNDSTSLLGNIVVTIFQDKQDNIWIGDESEGLSKLIIKNYIPAYFKSFKISINSTSNNGVNIIYEDSHNRFWIGSRKGLILFDREKQIFKRYTIKDGLPNDMIYGILEDKNGSLWLSTNNGISKATIRTNQNELIVSFKNYDKFDGLQNNQFNLWSYLKTALLHFLRITTLLDFNKRSPYLIPKVNSSMKLPKGGKSSWEVYNIQRTFSSSFWS